MAPALPLDPPGPLVLVIEDDRSARHLYAAILTDAGFRTAEAHNGFQAHEKAGELLPDAIVTDLGLPGIDGFQLCRLLQEDSRTRSIPLIGITGRFLADEDVARARRDGCRVVLLKPFTPEQLIAELEAVLRK